MKRGSERTGTPLVELSHNEDRFSGELAFSPDGRLIAGGTGGSVATVWDSTTGKMHREFAGHQGVVISVDSDRSGLRLVSGSTDASLVLWDIETGKQVRVIQGHATGIDRVRFGKTDDDLYSVAGNELKRWDLSQDQGPMTIRELPSTVVRMTMSPDGETLAGLGDNSELTIWDTVTERSRSGRRVATVA